MTRKGRCGLIFLVSLSASLILSALLWWSAHQQSRLVSSLPSEEGFVDSTPYELQSLSPLVPELPSSVKELGRVAWEGEAEKIAFDAKDSADAKFDVYLMSDTGGPVVCISCDVPELKGRNVGNPAWDPSGRWLLVQVENGIHTHGEIALPILVADPSYPGFGVSSSLWVYDTQTERFHLLYEIDGENGIGTLHPHFSHSGHQVTWARLVGSEGCMGDMEIMVADFKSTPEPRLENIRTLATEMKEEQRFFETQDFRQDHVLAACTPEPDQEHHFMDLCTVDSRTGRLERLTRRSGQGAEPGSWEEHAKFIDNQTLMYVSSRGYPSPVQECEIASAEFMKWLKTDVYVQDLSAPETAPERITFFNEPGHEMDCDCSNALASDFSWNERKQSAVIFVQYLNWPRYLPFPIGFEARYFILKLGSQHDENS